jgi:hypothetical protein
MPKVCLSNVASQYGIHHLALAPNLAPLWMSSMHGKKPALRSSREGSGGAAKAMPGAYDVSEKHNRYSRSQWRQQSFYGMLKCGGCPLGEPKNTNAKVL